MHEPVDSGSFGGHHAPPPTSAARHPMPPATAPASGGMGYGMGGASSGSDLFAAATGPLGSAGLDFGKQVVTSNMSRYLPGMALLWSSLKYYFDVNNSYVVNKLKLLLFPYRQSGWRRVTASDTGESSRHASIFGSGEIYKAPSEDLFAPDMYIPAMSFVTYVLITGILFGQRTHFTPEVLGQVTSTSVGTILLEIGCFKLALYLVSTPAPSLLDLISYASYKHVGLVLNLVVGMLFGKTLYYIVLLHTGAACAFFMLNTLKTATPDNDARSAHVRNWILMATAGMQLPLMWWMGYSGYL